MGAIIDEIVKSWGMFGVLLIGFGWLLYELWKNNRNYQKALSEMQSDLKQHTTDRVNIVEKQIEVIDEKVDNVESVLNERIDILSDRIDCLPEDNISVAEQHNNEKAKNHLKQIEDIMLLGGEMHKVTKSYVDMINADHLFIGSFHNGTSNLSGIPFCKFDIICECYGTNKVAHDHEFAPVYKDSDILRYGSLFSVLFQNEQMLFTVDPNGENNMAQHEDIIWRRMLGLGIKQMAVRILRDPNNTPSGFLGVVRYDLKDMDLKELENCARALERVYSINKYKKHSNVNKE